MFAKKFFILILLFVVLLAGQTVFAAYGLEDTASGAGLKPVELSSYIGKVIGAGLSLIGVVFFALMIYGGFLWMTAHGKEEQAKQGLETVLAAVIGLIIILAAYAITSFVFSSVGGGGGENKKNDDGKKIGCCVLAGSQCNGPLTESECQNVKGTLEDLAVCCDYNKCSYVNNKPGEVFEQNTADFHEQYCPDGSGGGSVWCFENTEEQGEKCVEVFNINDCQDSSKVYQTEVECTEASNIVLPPE